MTKSNAQQYGMVLWDETFARVAKDYPDVSSESVLVDAMSAKFVLKPEDLSVVVASNLNADILSDLGSALAGSLGLAASANYNMERRFPSMFEPVHGSAPDIAGQGVSNPIGTILSGALMLEHFGLADEAARVCRRRSTPPPARACSPATSVAPPTPTRSSTRSSTTSVSSPATPRGRHRIPSAAGGGHRRPAGRTRHVRPERWHVLRCMPIESTGPVMPCTRAPTTRWERWQAQRP